MAPAAPFPRPLSSRFLRVSPPKLMFSLMQLKESQQREQALSADLEAAKKAQQEAQQQLQQAQSQVQAARDAPMAIPSPSHRSTENGDPLSPPPHASSNLPP